MLETVLDQRIGVQLGDAVGLSAQLMEHLLGQQTRAAGGLPVGAEDVHTCLGTILHRPVEGEVDLWEM